MPSVTLTANISEHNSLLSNLKILDASLQMLSDMRMGLVFTLPPYHRSFYASLQFKFHMNVSTISDVFAKVQDRKS